MARSDQIVEPAIELGDVYQVGPHVVACGDLERGHAQALLAFVGTDGTMVYTDPPWNQGLATQFRRMVDGENAVVPEFDALIRAAFAAYAMVPGPVFVEMGHQHQPSMALWGRAVGLQVNNEWVVPYGKNTSCVTLLGRLGSPFPTMEPPGHLTGVGLVAWALRCQAACPRVFDPCLGLGTTAAACLATDRTLVGMELNPLRLAVAVGRLCRRLKVEPRKIGRLM